MIKRAITVAVNNYLWNLGYVRLRLGHIYTIYFPFFLWVKLVHLIYIYVYIKYSSIKMYRNAPGNRVCILIIRVTVGEYQRHIRQELFIRLVLLVLQLILDGCEVHGLHYHFQIIWNLEDNRFLIFTLKQSRFIFKQSCRVVVQSKYEVKGTECTCVHVYTQCYPIYNIYNLCSQLD